MARQSNIGALLCHIVTTRGSSRPLLFPFTTRGRARQLIILSEHRAAGGFFLFKLSLRVLSSPEVPQLGSWIFPTSPPFLRAEWQAIVGQKLGSGIQSQEATVSLQCWRPLTPSPEPRDKAAFHRDQHTRIGLVLKLQPGLVLGHLLWYLFHWLRWTESQVSRMLGTDHLHPI